MARKRTTPDQSNLSDTGTSSVANRRAAEAERQAEADRVRAELVKETKAARKATADFLATKPTDTRTIANTR
jgi:hypothetical protein